MTKEAFSRFLFQKFADFRHQATQELAGWRKMYLFRRPLLLLLVLYALTLVFLKKTGRPIQLAPVDRERSSETRAEIQGVVRGRPDPRPRGLILLVDVETIRPFRSKPISSSQSLLVQVANAPDTFAQPGDRIRIFGRVNRPASPLIPSTFDYAEYLRTRNIQGVVFTSTANVENLGNSFSEKWGRLGWSWNRKFTRIFERYLTSEGAAVLSGLVVGNRPRFHPDIRRIFTESGSMHILVASGSNVAFVVAIWFLLTRLIFRMKRRWALFSSLPPIWLYVLITGADPPIVRAGLMATIGILSYSLAREDRPLHVLGCTALILLLITPSSLFNLGFQMSFVSVFGMIYFLPSTEATLSRLSPRLKWLGRLVMATGTAQLWLFPVLISSFRVFYGGGLISNILILPLAAGGLSAGFALAGMDLLNRALVPTTIVLGLIQKITQGYVDLLIAIVRFFADHIRLTLWIPRPSLNWVLGYYLILFCVIGLRRSALCRLGVVMGILMLFAGSLDSLVKRRAVQKLTLTWIDVGRHADILCQTPTKKNYLICSSNHMSLSEIERIVLPTLTELGIRTLDGVALSRTSVAEREGFQTLLGNINVKNVVILDHVKALANRGGEIHSPIYSTLTSEHCWRDHDLYLQILRGSKRTSGEVPLHLSYRGIHVIVASFLPLKTQRDVLKRKLHPLHVLHTRFSPRLLWDDDFVRKLKPGIAVESSSPRKGRGIVLPWKNVAFVEPQKQGIYRWEAPQ